MKADPGNIFELSDVAAALWNAIERHMPNGFWVRAEILRLNHYPRSGHCYPDLVEKKGEKLIAQLRGTIWNTDFQQLNRKFRETTRADLADNMKVMVFATAGFHPLYGLSLNITDIEPSFTLGEMEKEKMATIATLKQEGVFDANRSLPFPLVLQRLAIVSVETSKGYHDFLDVISKEAAGFSVHHRLYPALLQGERAVASIRSALNRIRTHPGDFDAVLILRGGGGDAGLDCYNHHELARDVARFPLPVMTGIGHSTNQTVVEMVAAVNNITPTQVAYQVAQSFHDISRRLAMTHSGIQASSERFILGERSRHLDLAKALAGEASASLRSAHMLLDASGSELSHRTSAAIATQGVMLARNEGMLRHLVRFALREGKQLLSSLPQALHKAVSQQTKESKKQLANLARNLALLDPANTLKRGYSITRINGTAVRDASQLSPGDRIDTTLLKGTIISTVESNQKK